MKKEKESWTLLWVWTAYLPVKEIKWEFYVKVSDFTRCMDSMRKELEEENKKLKRQIDDWKDKYSRLDRIAGENVITLDVMNADIIELKEENEELKEKLNKAWLEEYWFFNEY